MNLKKNLNIYLMILFIVLLGLNIFLLTRNKEVPSNEDYVNLYKSLIDDIMIENKTLNKFDKYIAIDMKGFSLIEKNIGYEEMILSHAYKYNNNVFVSTYNNLEEKGYVNGGSLEGLFITSNVLKKNKYGNKIEIEISKYVAPLGSNGISYKAIFKNGKWNLDKKSMFIS